MAQWLRTLVDKRTGVQILAPMSENSQLPGTPETNKQQTKSKRAAGAATSPVTHIRIHNSEQQLKICHFVTCIKLFVDV